MPMDIFKITGPVRLDGEITVGGSKNAALPIMAATLLAGGKSTLHSIPNLSDIGVMGKLLEDMGCKVETAGGTTSIDAT
ncbi:MAG: UDP-N-acetylglucosamine 1-carboxyvinyltransferase, partial [Phycisphaerae bacterium]